MIKFPDPKDYPKEIYVKNETYKIVFTRAIKHYGDTDCVKCVIRIRSGMSRRVTFCTFIHELLHAIHFEGGFKLGHKKVYKLEEGIVEVIVDNFLGVFQ